MSEAGTFVYLLEEEAVLAILPGWPTGIQVAICLVAGGACDLAVHHRDEVARVLGRIAELHGLSSDDLCVAPEVEGYSTRRMLFSEEQQLLSIVGESPHLVELASDYALNYRFAQDEGLDADTVTGANGGPALKAEVSRAEAPSPKGMSKRSKAFITHLSLPAGYAAASSDQRPACDFVEANLYREGGKIRLIIAPEKATGTEAVVKVTRIGCRDDYARFVLPRNVLGNWSEGQSAVLEMAEDLFPEAVVHRFMREPQLCNVTITVRGVFITPLGPVASASIASVTSAPLGATRAKRRIVKSVHVAVAGLVAVMVVTGHLAAALDRSAAEEWDLYGHTDGATAAMDLIATLAREGTVD